jgi:hypothetical protein
MAQQKMLSYQRMAAHSFLPAWLENAKSVQVHKINLAFYGQI